MENLTDEEVIQLIESKHIRSHALEKELNNPLRGVEVRRKFVLKQSHVKNKNLDSVHYKDYDYEKVSGACAENVIGMYKYISDTFFATLKWCKKIYAARYVMQN